MKRVLISLIISALMVIAPGCDGNQVLPSYKLYYVNNAGTKLNSYNYETETADINDLLMEFMNSMAAASGDDGRSVIPSMIKTDSIVIHGELATVAMNGSMEEVDSGERLLLYAAVTRALCQVDSVSGVIMTVNGEPVTDTAGTEMGIMRPARFVNNASDDPDDYEESRVTLYFASEDGERLVRTTTTVAYRSSIPLERVVIERLIAGPGNAELIAETEEKVTATLPSGLTLLGISIKDRVCYVNIDDKIIKAGEVSSDAIAVYSMVNTLVELNTVDSVQITINGASDVKMPLGLSLNQPFKYNNTIVK